MSRVAIIGNSHVAMLRSAADQIAAAYPGLQVDYFALPRHRFFAAELGKDGVFRADTRKRSDRKLIQKINGALEIDLQSYDRILVAAHGFNLAALYKLSADHDVLGFETSGRDHSVSPAFLSALIDARVSGFAQKMNRFLRKDPRFVVAHLPFPTLGAIQADHEAAALVDHPAAAHIETLYLQAIDQAMTRIGLGYLAPLEQARERPFLTQARFARAAERPSDAPVQGGDYTHMNSVYGLEIFKVFANRWLGLQAQPSPQIREV